MKILFVGLFIFWAIVAGSMPLMLRNEGVRISEALSNDGWNRICTYYTPFRLEEIRQHVRHACSWRREMPSRTS
jgi:hypothetical protein